jgi:hypothetical protein
MDAEMKEEEERILNQSKKEEVIYETRELKKMDYSEDTAAKQN